MENIKLYTLDNVPDYLKDDYELAMNSISMIISSNMQIMNTSVDDMKHLFKCFDLEYSHEKMNELIELSTRKMLNMNRLENRVKNDRKLKFLVRDIEKQNGLVSPSARGLLATYIFNVLADASNISLQDIFQIQDDLIGYFTLSLEDVEMKYFFNDFLLKTILLKDMDRFNNQKYIENLSASFSYLHAQFLLYYTQEEKDERIIETLKSKIESLLNSTNDEIRSTQNLREVGAQERRNDILSYLENLTDNESILDDLNSVIESDLSSKTNTTSVNLHKKRSTQDEIDRKIESHQLKKLEKMYNKYFKYNENIDNLEEYMEDVLMVVQNNTYNMRKNKNVINIQKLSAFLSPIIQREFDLIQLQKQVGGQTVSYIWGFLMYNFAMMLAHHFLTDAYGNIIENRAKLALELFEKNDCVEEHYTKINDFIQKKFLLYEAYPGRKDLLVRTSALLMNIDVTAINKPILKIIEDEPRADDSFRQMYESKNINVRKNLDLSTKHNTKLLDFSMDTGQFVNVGAFAEEFIIAYLEDREYIASYCAFTRFAFYKIKGSFFLYMHENETNPYKRQLSKDEKDMKDDLISIIYGYIDPTKIQNRRTIQHAISINYTLYNDILTSTWPGFMVNYEEKIVKAMFTAYTPEEYKELSKDRIVEECYLIAFICRHIDTILDGKDYSVKTDFETDRKIAKLNKRVSTLESENRKKDEQLKKERDTVIKNERSLKEKAQKDIAKQTAAYKQELSDVNKKLNDTLNELEEIKKENAELSILRDMYITLKENEENQIETILNVDLTELSGNFRILVIGGHYKVIDRLKAKYPMIEFYTDELNKEDNVRNADYVFFMYKFMNHSMFYKYVEIVREYDIKFDYIMNNNVDKIEAHIYNFIKGSN